jgi:diaminopimelate epimerase
MTRRLRFTKMQGLGNDFVVLDGVREKIDLEPAAIRRLADRHFGVGCDQVLLVEKPTRPDVDFRYRIFNADGGEVEQCGNGARCFVQFVRAHGLTDKRAIRVETAGGIIEPTLAADGQVTVDMGAPAFRAADVPFLGGSGAIVEPLEIDGETVMVSVLSLGNPHAVQLVGDVDAAPVTTQGPRIETHSRFPRRVNAGYSRSSIALTSLARVGPASADASCRSVRAAAIAAVRRGLVDSPVRFATPEAS